MSAARFAVHSRIVAGCILLLLARFAILVADALAATGVAITSKP